MTSEQAFRKARQIRREGDKARAEAWSRYARRLKAREGKPVAHGSANAMPAQFQGATGRPQSATALGHEQGSWLWEGMR